MPKIAFFNLPAFGHIRPTLPLVSELVARDAQVLYFIDEAFAADVAAAGATAVPLPYYGHLPRGTLPRDFVELACAMLEQSAGCLPALIDAVRAEQIDCIVHDSFCPWGRFVAEICQLPAVRTCSVLLALDPALPRMRVPLAVVGKVVRSLPAFLRYRRLRRELARDYGLERLRIADLLRNRASRSLVFMSREFLPHSEQLDDSYTFIGASMPAGDPAPVTAAGARPLVYIALGATATDRPDIYRLCVDALGALEVDVLMVVGRGFDRALLGPLPDNFEVAEHVAQTRLLARASVFVSHAGINSVTESLYHGVPLVLLPEKPEQAFNADCVVAHGAGLRLTLHGLDAQRLREAVNRLMTDPHFEANAARLGRSLVAAGGAARGAEAIVSAAAAPVSATAGSTHRSTSSR